MKSRIRTIFQETRIEPEGWLPYFMLILLFGIVFALPVYAAKYQGSQRYGQERMRSGSVRTQEEEMIHTKGDGLQPTIVLDPGHGGRDNGMTGPGGISEKVLNLIFAQKLAVLLEQEGYRVVLTRTTLDGLYDEDADNKKAQDMQRRCALIEAEQPVLTVSIHQNSYSDPSVRGPQVFYYEASAEGQKLAKCIQDRMNEQLAIARPRVQKANDSYYILKQSAGVTALVEAGFLTNPEEEALLQDEIYQDKAVRAICDGILDYLSQING